jgi:hypothetical protein
LNAQIQIQSLPFECFTLSVGRFTDNICTSFISNYNNLQIPLPEKVPSLSSVYHRMSPKPVLMGTTDNDKGDVWTHATGCLATRASAAAACGEMHSGVASYGSQPNIPKSCIMSRQ